MFVYSRFGTSFETLIDGIRYQRPHDIPPLWEMSTYPADLNVAKVR
jgi:hypothetical protein